MEITVQKRNVYGKDLIYPVCDKAKLFALIGSRQTFRDLDITAIKKLGYTINLQQEPSTL